MSRGRRAKPAEIKALLGNPGKRRLALLSPKAGASGADVAPSIHVPEPPSFLDDDEREAFAFVYETMPLNLVRESDKVAVSRWAGWLVKWVNAKRRLADKGNDSYVSVSKHGSFVRVDADFNVMCKAEANLVTLEDRLGLNTVARSNLTSKLFQMPGPHPGALFEDDEPAAGKKPAAEAPAVKEEIDPLGFLDGAGKQYSPSKTH